MQKKYSWAAVSSCLILSCCIITFWLVKFLTAQPNNALIINNAIPVKFNNSNIGNQAKLIFSNNNVQIQNVKLIGIVNNSERGQYIILNINNTSNIYKLNQEVPNLGKINNIDNTKISIQNINGHLQEIALEKRDPKNNENFNSNTINYKPLNLPQIDNAQENLNDASSKIMDKNMQIAIPANNAPNNIQQNIIEKTQ